jgi:hypothetical protein
MPYENLKIKGYPMPDTTAKSEQCTCRKCNKTFIPSFAFDFYPDGDDPKVGLCESCMMSQVLGSSKPAPVSVSVAHMEKVCKPGKGAETCIFLLMGEVWKCAKGSDFQAEILKRRPTMKSQGDNCSGPPGFTPTE